MNGKTIAILRDRNFNGAFIFSVLWHLVWMSIIVIVVVPNNLDIGKYTNISFLGSYLSETNIAPDFKEQKNVSVSSYHIKDMLDIEKVKFDLPERSYVQPGVSAAKNTVESVFALQEKKIYSAEPARIKTPEYAKTENNDIEGELRSRAILYKPHKLFSKRGPGRFEEAGAEVRLNFEVSGDGEVKFVNVVNSTGNPELDTIFTSYIKSWKFEPLTGEPGRIQTGSVKLVF